MKSGFFIMMLSRSGNVGPNEIEKLEANPEDGFETADAARTAMEKLHKEGNWELNERQYSFTIMELFWRD